MSNNALLILSLLAEVVLTPTREAALEKMIQQQLTVDMPVIYQWLVGGVMTQGLSGSN